jgi:hypothetical protein
MPPLAWVSRLLLDLQYWGLLALCYRSHKPMPSPMAKTKNYDWISLRMFNNDGSVLDVVAGL